MLKKDSPEAREMIKQTTVVRKDTRWTAVAVWALVGLEALEKGLPFVLEILNAIQ